MRTLRRFWQSEKGATAIEYAIIAGGTGVTAIGTPLNNTFTSVAGSVK